MGVLAQKEEPIDLVIARDYRRHWPVPIATSCFDNLPPRTVPVRAGRPGCSRDQDEGGQEEAHPGKGGVSRIFNIIVQATPGGDAGGGLAGETAARVAFACPEGEDEAVAEVKIVDEEEEKQFRVLKEQRKVHRKRYKALKEAVREHGSEDLLLRARAHLAAQRAAGEETETAKTKLQEKGAETELSGADQAATERGKKEGSTERSAKRRTEEGERVESAPSAAGGTSAAAAGNTQRERQKGKTAPPAAGGTSEVAAVRPEWSSRPDKSTPTAAGGTSAAAADKSERPGGKGKLTPSAAGGTSEAAVSEPEQGAGPLCRRLERPARRRRTQPSG
jgi:hypothetical protein